MWQKIKRGEWRKTRISLPISTKMVLLYSSIVSFILLLVAIITVTGIHLFINESARSSLYASAEATEAYLNAYGRMDPSVLTHANLQPFVKLQIYDQSGKLLLDNGPAHLMRNLSDRYIDDTITGDGSPPLPSVVQNQDAKRFIYYQTWQNPQGQTFYLRFERDTTKENEFLELLSEYLVVSILICIALTTISGTYLMKRALAPIERIKETLKGIEVPQLGKRISLSGRQNELSSLAVTINQALDRIEAGYNRQQRFINDASHELRTPLTVIMGYIDLLDRWGKNDPAIVNESIDAIKSETDYMQQLIERLLFFARSSNGTLQEHFEKIDSAELLKDLYEKLLPVADGRRIILGENESAPIYADPASVKQMLRIFTDNALKYTDPGNTVTLSCRVVKSTVSFSVRDTGIGIPEKDIPHVFDRFYRVDTSRTKDTGGSGLGLSIARYIARNNNAALKLDSKLGEGTVVTAIFPVYEKDLSPAGETPPSGNERS